MSYMLDEIKQQPDAIRKLVSSEQANAKNIAAEIKRRQIRFGIVAARGTSDNAATYGKYIFEILNGLPVSLAAPSVFTLYNARPNLENVLVIGISQSGQAADVTEYLQRSKECGALTVCITNEASSSITKVSDFTVLCHAGSERSVAATKTYTTALAALCLVSATLSCRDDIIGEIIKTSAQIEQVIESSEEEIARRAERYRYMEDCIILSRGINRATAFEAALKLEETCYISADPFSSTDFLHGPIAVVEEGTPCFLYAPEGPTFDSMLDMASRLNKKGAELIVASGSREILSLAATPFRMPVEVDEFLSPIVYIVVGQLFAQYLAVSKRLDPDHPRGLSKVTITR